MPLCDEGQVISEPVRATNQRTPREAACEKIVPGGDVDLGARPNEHGSDGASAAGSFCHGRA
jgi:hypothetical protein